MAIQFFCPSCGQPIEVDDEMANQPVACPYCRATATTPAATDPSVKSSAPQAGEGDIAGLPSAEIAGTPGGSPLLQEKEPPRSKLGWIALACACLAIACIYLTGDGFSPITQFVQDLDPNISDEEKSSLIEAETTKLIQEHPWLIIVGILGVCALPVACIVFAIIALVKKARPRWPAIVALVLPPVLLVLLMCVGFAQKAASPAGQAPM